MAVVVVGLEEGWWWCLLCVGSMDVLGWSDEVAKMRLLVVFCAMFGF